MPLTRDLRHFKLSEFKHPELVEERAALWLDELREVWGQPIILTDDARPPGVIPPGGSAKSLHFKGQAFDFRIRHLTWGGLWTLGAAVYTLQRSMPDGESGIEFELVWSHTDKHAHVAFPNDGRKPRLIIQAE